MCFSASASFSAAVVLVGAGAYALHQAKQLVSPYWRLWALIPIFFGVQQAMEGGVWLALHTGNTERALVFGLGFHCFSHFLWPWWLAFCSYFVEPAKLRKRLFGACTLLGLFAGTMVIVVMFTHSEWMSVSMEQHSITYKFRVPYKSTIHSPITPAAFYAMVILLPLLLSSHKHLRVFGCLVALSSILTSVVYSYAYVSVWCFFAAVLSLYLIYMIRALAAAPLISASSAAPAPPKEKEETRGLSG